MHEAMAEPAALLHRHALVWARIATADDAIDCAASDRATVTQWLAAQRPLIVRRQPASARRDHVALGLPLPPSAGKRRIALTLRVDAIARTRAPPALDAVIPRAPRRRRGPLSRLRDSAEGAGIELRVFGAFAWQMLAGITYVTRSSDLDLWWRPASPAQLDAGIALLAAWERASGVRADGEIVFGDDDAVAWREWHERAAHARVLVKRLDAVRMAARSELLALVGRASATLGTGGAWA